MIQIYFAVFSKKTFANNSLTIEFREAFNAALAKVLANPAKMLERAGEYGYDKAQLPPADMTTEWACSTK